MCMSALGDRPTSTGLAGDAAPHVLNVQYDSVGQAAGSRHQAAAAVLLWRRRCRAYDGDSIQIKLVREKTFWRKTKNKASV